MTGNSGRGNKEEEMVPRFQDAFMSICKMVIVKKLREECRAVYVNLVAEFNPSRRDSARPISDVSLR